MKSRTLVKIALSACVAAPLALGSLWAREGGAPAPSSRLDSFVGDGICTGRTEAMEKQPSHATSARVHGEKTLGGHWAVIHYEEEKTADNPRPFSVTQFIGYDETAKRFVTVSFDNTGSSYSAGTSPGWKGASITFEETIGAGGKRIAVRDIFTNGDSGVSSHTGMMRDEKGKWVKTDEEVCHKG